MGSFCAGGAGTPAAVRSSADRALEGGLPELSPDLLRGVSVPTVLRGCGTWWRTSPAHVDLQAQADWLYGFSQPVEVLDRFLSHSWHAPWPCKVMCLHMFFNGALACAGALLITVLYGGVVSSGLLGDGLIVMGSYEWVYSTAYWLLLLQGQWICEMGRWLPWTPSHSGRCFLDKLCIYQAEGERKSQGIIGLSAFLLSSRRMTIIWDRTYWTRLWCIFEVAVYCRLRPEQVLESAPVYQGVMEFSIAVVETLSSLSAIGLELGKNASSLSIERQALQLCRNLLFVALVRMQLRNAQAVDVELRRFSVRAAKCFSESDRRYVEEVIDKFYGSHAEFERIIRDDVRKRMIESLPLTQYSSLYWLALRLQCFHQVPRLLEAWSDGLALEVVFLLLKLFLLVPSQMITVATLSRLHPHTKYCCLELVVCLCTAAVASVGDALWQPLFHLIIEHMFKMNEPVEIDDPAVETNGEEHVITSEFVAGITSILLMVAVHWPVTGLLLCFCRFCREGVLEPVAEGSKQGRFNVHVDFDVDVVTV